MAKVRVTFETEGEPEAVRAWGESIVAEAASAGKPATVKVEKQVNLGRGCGGRDIIEWRAA